MTIAHILGFPRIGVQRELKKALESYWANKSDEQALLQCAQSLRKKAWQAQIDNGCDLVTVGDFSLYDHILDFSLLLNIIPQRHRALLTEEFDPLEAYFLMARGQTAKGKEATASELTKWFDTNYHYIVPEFEPDMQPKLNSELLLAQVAEAKAFGRVKVVIPGLISYLWLGKAKQNLDNKLSLLPILKPLYQALIRQLADAGVEVIQIDEPCIVHHIPQDWIDALQQCYDSIDFYGTTSILASYFESPNLDLKTLFGLNFSGFHWDFAHSSESISEVAAALPANKILSAGVINGRNIWKSDLNALVEALQPVAESLQDRLWIAPSCSLLHVPYDLALETTLDSDLKDWLAFAQQKLAEMHILKGVLQQGKAAFSADLSANAASIRSRKHSNKINDPIVAQALNNIQPKHLKRRSDFAARQALQQQSLNFPLFPTTSIGSFPQTKGIRKIRLDYKKGRLDTAQYQAAIRAEIKEAIHIQESIGIDVLVHGEAERNDMVEYFGEQLQGFAFSSHGWVQSYGSRCVKPPIIFGDVSRPEEMTVDWIRYAQSLTEKQVKGMLTGPVTILKWSFARDDQPLENTCKQIALAILSEVQSLERAGVKVIQVDEPALREGLPLKAQKHAEYLQWATDAFRIATCDVSDNTQIHTHMCYCEFSDIMSEIIGLDADVISIETSRSQMELLDVFKAHQYPNAIGPGVYDIHSPRVPTVDEIKHLLIKAAQHIDAKRLWVNPDCGLKTRDWKETKLALINMVEAAQSLRKQGLETQH